MVSTNLIELFQTKCPSPTRFAVIKDGIPQFCVENLLINAIASPDSSLTTRMDDFIDSFRDARKFSTLEASICY